MPRWFEIGTRLDDELQALESEGIEFEIDEDARAAGLIRLDLHLPANRGWPDDLQLHAVYPDSYPYFRPVVFAPTLALKRHQHPFARNLCLLGRSTLLWDIDKTLAEHLKQQLGQVIERAGLGPENLQEMDDEQAEPYSDYYQYSDPLSIIVMDDCVIPPDVARGRFLFGHVGEWLARPTGAVVGVLQDNRTELWEAPEWLRSRFPRRQGFRWTRVNRPPTFSGHGDAESWLRRHHPSLLVPAHQWQPIGSRHLHLIGLVFPEEVRPGEHEDAWLFVALTRSPDGRAGLAIPRTHRYGREYLAMRSPELAFLPASSAAVVGLGCIGAPIALELARSGIGTLRLADHDLVQAGTTRRWPFGLTASGQPKSKYIAEFIGREYPSTTVDAFGWHIGAPRADPAQPSEWEFVERLFEGVDVVIDATAEFGVHHFLSDLARERAVPYLAASGTPGGWGGELVRIRPGVTEGCWTCLQHHLHEDASLPIAPFAPDDQGFTQPAGCADPTFTGAGFDLRIVAQSAVRLTVSTLSAIHGGQYPPTSWDFCSILLRADNGDLSTPRFNTSAIVRHPACRARHAH